MRISIGTAALAGVLVLKAIAANAVIPLSDPRHEEVISLGVVAHAALEYQIRRGMLPRDVSDLRADRASLLPTDWQLQGSLYFYQRDGKPWLSWHGVDAAAACTLEDATHARCIAD
jgi:hypothetical protein